MTEETWLKEICSQAKKDLESMDDWRANDGLQYTAPRQSELEDCVHFSVLDEEAACA